MCVKRGLSLKVLRVAFISEWKKQQEVHNEEVYNLYLSLIITANHKFYWKSKCRSTLRRLGGLEMGVKEIIVMGVEFVSAGSI
jgi:hypothetical protein